MQRFEPFAERHISESETIDVCTLEKWIRGNVLIDPGKDSAGSTETIKENHANLG